MLLTITTVASYADIAARNSEQSPEEAAAPQPLEIIPNESTTTSTGSLIDVDTQSVRTVPSDFMEQSIQTDTQADRVEREEQAHKLRVEAKRKREAARKKAARADDWLAGKIASLSDNGASGVLYGNAAVVVALGGVLGYQGWGLYQRGVLSWKHAGIGAAVLSTVAVVENVFYRYFTKARSNKA